MVRNVTLTIDQKSVTVPENTTILEAARSVNINIPTLCYLKDINEIGACRICCVEVEGMERLVPACDNVVADGMVVFTNSAKAREARRMNLRLILSHHDTSCTNCTRSGNCTLQQLANDFNMRGTHFPKKLRHEAVDYSTPLIRENDKCVQCLRCIQVCENVQSVKIWDLLGTGSRTVVDASYNRRIQDTECTYCGQCITHCPTAALRERDDTGLVFDAIDDPNVVTVAQVAPAVRAAWAEQFGLDSEFATPKRMVAALRELGFNYVFDTDFAADLTIMEEGSELLYKMKHSWEFRRPLFTSCCPGWVRFLKLEYPDMVPQLSTAKSPQQMFGAVTKTWFAKTHNIDPKDIFCVSVMPCVAKKYECAVPEINSSGFRDVDEDAWYHEAVDYALDNGLMSGVSDREFAPGSTLTRAMVAQMLYSLEGKPAAGSADFADVAEGAWYADAISWAAGEGIVSGYGDTFGPNDPITREQLAAILYRYAGSPAASSSAKASPMVQRAIWTPPPSPAMP